MSEVRSALAWEKGEVSLSPLTVTLQEVEVQKKHLTMAIVCEGEGREKMPQLAGGYLCESMVGWFYNTLLPRCSQKPECSSDELETELRAQWEMALREWQQYLGKRGAEDNVHICGILVWENRYAAWGNRPVYILNRRFNKPRKKNILPPAKGVTYISGEIGSFLRFYIENESMNEGIKEQELLESLYAEDILEELRLVKRLGELGKEAVARTEGRSVGAVILEVEP